MKRIKLNSEEGKALAAKYGINFMQDGGKITMSEIITGSKVTGVNPEVDQHNAEVEKGEFIQFPDKVVSEVVGKTHEQGGEKMQLEEGTKILSDNVKIGKDLKNALGDLFDIASIKSSTTFADTHKKIKKAIGVEMAEKEQEKVLTEIDKNKEVKDEDTRRVNEEFLAAKLNDTEEALQRAKAQESFVFDLLFSAQEGRKKSKDKNIRVTEEEDIEFQDGGVMSETDYIEKINSINTQLENSNALSNDQRIALENDLLRLNVGLDNLLAAKEAPPSQVQAPVNNTNTTTNRFSTATNDDGVPTLKLDFLGGKFSYDDLSEEDKTKAQQEIDAYVTKLAELQGKTYEEALADVIITGSSSKTPVSKSLQNKLGVKNSSEGNQVLAQKRADLMEQLFKDTASNKGIDITKITFTKKVTPEIGPDYTQGTSTEKYKPFQSMGLTVDVSAIPKERAMDVNQAATLQPQDQLPPRPTQQYQNIFGFLPEAYVPKPSGLLTTSLNLPQFETVSPVRMSPEAALRENNRMATNAMDIVSQNVGSQQGANLANVIAKTSQANNQIVAETEAKNAQLKYQTDVANASSRSQENVARTQAMDIFGEQSIRALENTQNELQNYFAALSQEEMGRNKELRDINTLSAFSENYQINPLTGQVMFIDRGFNIPNYQTPLAAKIVGQGVGNNDQQQMINKAIAQYLRQNNQV